MKKPKPISISLRGGKFVITCDPEHFAALYGAVLIDEGSRRIFNRRESLPTFKARVVIATVFKRCVRRFLDENSEPKSSFPSVP